MNRRALLLVLMSTVLLGQTGQVRTVVEGSGYFPVLIRLQSGELLAVLRGGGSHVDVRGRLDMVMSKDEGRTWSAPWTVVDGPFDDRNPALGQLQDGTVLLSYAVAQNYDETGLKFKGTRKDRVFDGVYVMRSKDKGRTWSSPVRSEAIHRFYTGQGLVSPYGKMAQLPDGTVLMAVYFEFFNERGFQSFVFRSHDSGATWTEPALIGAGFNETSIAVMPSGDVLAALRAGKGQSLSVARSRDGGRTWSQPEQVTRDLQHPADLILLKNRHVLLAYGERNAPRGVKAMLSTDNGQTWNKASPITLVNDAPVVDCGYPSSALLRDGRIVTMYYQVDDPNHTPASAKAKTIIWSEPKP